MHIDTQQYTCTYKRRSHTHLNEEVVFVASPVLVQGDHVCVLSLFELKVSTEVGCFASCVQCQRVINLRSSWKNSYFRLGSNHTLMAVKVNCKLRYNANQNKSRKITCLSLSARVHGEADCRGMRKRGHAVWVTGGDSGRVKRHFNIHGHYGFGPGTWIQNMKKNISAKPLVIFFFLKNIW